MTVTNPIRGSFSSPIASEEHEAVLAELIESQLRAEDRAERVAVRVLVGDEQEAVVRADRVRDRGKLTRH